MSGTIPNLSHTKSLLILDLSDNRFSDNINIGNIFVPGQNNSLRCDMSENNFECPVTWQSYLLCNARCVIRIFFKISIGDDVIWQVFCWTECTILQHLTKAGGQCCKFQLVEISGCTLICDKHNPKSPSNTQHPFRKVWHLFMISRCVVDDTFSVIVDLIVGPPPSKSFNEGNAQRTVQQIQKMALAGKIQGYQVIS